MEKSNYMDKMKKEKRYERLYKQIESHMYKTEDKISKMATIIAILHNKIRYYFWTGFYFVKDVILYRKDNKLINNTFVDLNDKKLLKEVIKQNKVKIFNKPDLVVGPYQGSLACLNLNYPSGVCWYAVLNNTTIIVEDVHKFPGHIACDSRSKSEIVIPVYNKKGEMYAVFDIDSDKFSSFDDIDKKWLEKIVNTFLV